MFQRYGTTVIRRDIAQDPRDRWDGALTPEHLPQQADAPAVQWAFPCRRKRATQVSQISRPDAAASSIVR
jgi:hypothetical protein